MNITVGENEPLIAVGGADAPLAAPRTGVDIDRGHLDALNHHQPLAIVVRPRLHARIRPIGPRHRTIDRIVDVAFDDEEAGEAARDLIVRGPVRVRVIPVRARRMRLRRRTGPAAIRCTLPSGCSYCASPMRSCGASVRHARIGRRLAHLPVGMRQDAQERVVAAVPFALKPGSTCSPCVCRFVVCDPCGTFT